MNNFKYRFWRQLKNMAMFYGLITVFLEAFNGNLSTAFLLVGLSALFAAFENQN